MIPRNGHFGQYDTGITAEELERIRLFGEGELGPPVYEGDEWVGPPIKDSFEDFFGGCGPQPAPPEGYHYENCLLVPDTKRNGIVFVPPCDEVLGRPPAGFDYDENCKLVSTRTAVPEQPWYAQPRVWIIAGLIFLAVAGGRAK